MALALVLACPFLLKEDVRPLWNMGYKPDIQTLNARAIEGCIENNDLNTALTMLKEWADASHNRAVRKVVISLKRRHTEIKQEERLDRLSFTKISRFKSKLTHDILSLLEDISPNNV